MKKDIHVLAVIISYVLETAVFLSMLAFQSWLLNTLHADYQTATEELLSVVVMIGIATEAYLWCQPRIEAFIFQLFQHIIDKLNA